MMTLPAHKLLIVSITPRPCFFIGDWAYAGSLDLSSSASPISSPSGPRM